MLALGSERGMTKGTAQAGRQGPSGVPVFRIKEIQRVKRHAKATSGSSIAGSGARARRLLPLVLLPVILLAALACGVTSAVAAPPTLTFEPEPEYTSANV